jgi:hypothetical protein
VRVGLKFRAGSIGGRAVRVRRFAGSKVRNSSLLISIRTTSKLNTPAPVVVMYDVSKVLDSQPETGVLTSRLHLDGLNNWEFDEHAAFRGPFVIRCPN